MTFTNPNNLQNTKRTAHSAQRTAHSAQRKNKLFISLLSCVMLLFANTIELKAQSGQKWSTNGNSTNNGDFIGTTNNEPLLLKTNSQTVIRLKPNGDIIFKPFQNIGLGLLAYDNDGKLLPYTFNGNANTFLSGNGSFVSSDLISGWKIDGPNNNLVQATTGNVGIGTTSPIVKLHVAGDAYVEGFVFTQGISIIGRAFGQKLYSDTIDVKRIEMDSLKSISGETRIDGTASVSQKLGVGTKYPEAELDVRGNMALSGEARIDGYVIIPSLANAAEDILVTDGFGKVKSISQYDFVQRIYSSDIGIPIGDPCNPIGDPNIAPPNGGGNNIAALSLASTQLIVRPTWSNAHKKMWVSPVCPDINVGIGCSDPLATLDIKGVLRLRNFADINQVDARYLTVNQWGQVEAGMAAGYNWSSYGNAQTSSADFLGTTDWNPLVIKTDNIERINIASNGIITLKSILNTLDFVNIGTTNTDVNYKLQVLGTIRAIKVIVETGWSDYVFEDDYKLMPLLEVEQFIKANKHLPKITKGSDVESKGLDIGAMQATHMEKIEELTLYLIEQNKQIEELKKEIQALKSK